MLRVENDCGNNNIPTSFRLQNTVIDGCVHGVGVCEEPQRVLLGPGDTHTHTMCVPLANGKRALKEPS